MSDLKETWTSKLGTTYPRPLILQLEESHKKSLKTLRTNPTNTICMDCGQTESGLLSWAVVNLGIFVCVRCASLHRGVGTHVSKVKGLSGTYLWGPDEVERMKAIGNAKAAEVYGPHDGFTMRDADDARLRAFILDRYDRKVWMNVGGAGMAGTGRTAGAGTQEVPANFDPFEIYESASEGESEGPKSVRQTTAGSVPKSVRQTTDEFFEEMGV